MHASGVRVCVLHSIIISVVVAVVIVVVVVAVVVRRTIALTRLAMLTAYVSRGCGSGLSSMRVHANTGCLYEYAIGRFSDVVAVLGIRSSIHIYETHTHSRERTYDRRRFSDC